MDRHPAVDAVCPRQIIRAGDDPGQQLGDHCERQIHQLRAIAGLHRCEEGVGVRVQDRLAGHRINRAGRCRGQQG